MQPTLIDNYQQFRRPYQQSPAPLVHQMSIYTNGNSTPIYSHEISPSTPFVNSTQSPAYFLDRIDVDNYSSQTLKQLVETVLSNVKSKGSSM